MYAPKGIKKTKSSWSWLRGEDQAMDALEVFQEALPSIPSDLADQIELCALPDGGSGSEQFLSSRGDVYAPYSFVLVGG